MDSHPTASEVQQHQSSDVRPLTFFLTAGVLRGRTNVPILHVNKGDRPIELQIEVRDGLETRRSITILVDLVPVFEQEHLVVKSEGPLRFIAVRLRPGTLKPGPYRIRIAIEGASSHSNALSMDDRIFEVQY